MLYVGKIRVSQKKVPNSFIDDALEKFRLHELEKNKKSSSTNTSRRGSQINVNLKFIILYFSIITTSFPVN